LHALASGLSTWSTATNPCNKPMSYCFLFPCSLITIFWPNPRGYKPSTWLGTHLLCSSNPALQFNLGS
jgi:hypothetical protein